MSQNENTPGYLEGPAYATPCPQCETITMERTWLHVLVFLACAWLVIGGVLGGITLALTGSPWALAWLAPCFIFIGAGFMQAPRVAKAVKAHER